MRQQHITLGLGLLFAAGFLALLAAAAAPSLTMGSLCPDLALASSPVRLVSQVQSGLAAVLGCGAD
jgi:membrane-bound metal-dependent hydrolase YbcI (DUF457 family)